MVSLIWTKECQEFQRTCWKPHHMRLLHQRRELSTMTFVCLRPLADSAGVLESFFLLRITIRHSSIAFNRKNGAKCLSTISRSEDFPTHGP